MKNATPPFNDNDFFRAMQDIGLSFSPEEQRRILEQPPEEEEE